MDIDSCKWLSAMKHFCLEYVPGYLTLVVNRHRFGTIEIDNITLSDASLYGQLLYTNYKVFGTF